MIGVTLATHDLPYGLGSWHANFQKMTPTQVYIIIIVAQDDDDVNMHSWPVTSKGKVDI